MNSVRFTSYNTFLYKCTFLSRQGASGSNNRYEREYNDYVLPSSPSIPSDLSGFVQSRINFFSEESEFKPFTFTSYTSPASSSSSSLEDNEHEAFEVLDALSCFDSIGSSETQSGGSSYDQLLSPVPEVDEPCNRGLLYCDTSLEDEVFTDSSSHCDYVIGEASSDQSWQSIKSSSLTSHQGSDEWSDGSSDEETSYNASDQGHPIEYQQSSSTGSDPDSIDGSECSELDGNSQEDISSLVPEEKSKKLIVIKFIDKSFNGYESVKPFSCHNEKLSAERDFIKKKRKPVLLNDDYKIATVDDPFLKEMIESFDVEDILKVLDEPSILDNSSLLNSQFEETVVLQTASCNDLNEGNAIEEFKSPLISSVDDVIENLTFDFELTFCPCAPMQKCTIL